MEAEAESKAEAEAKAKWINLSDLPAAQKDPNVPRWWKRTCWGVFAVGMLVVLISTMVFSPGSYLLLLALRTVIFFALVGLAVNTYVAAERFGKRREAINAWIRSRVPYLEARKHKNPNDVSDASGKLSMYRHNHPEHYQYYTVVAKEECQPQPFRGGGVGTETGYRLEEYMRLIDREVEKARGEAARLAAAMGVLLIAALQVYLRLFRP